MKYLKLILVNSSIFVVLLLVAEFFLRILYSDYHLYKRTFPNQNIEELKKNVVVDWPKLDSTLGWTCKPSSRIIFTNHSLNDSSIKYTINNEGFRNVENFSEIDKKSKCIMMLGDSFLFGVYLADSNTISSRLSELLQNTQVINLGIPGYGIDQMYLSYLQYNSDLNCEIIIVVYIDENITRTFEAFRLPEGMKKPSFKITNNKLHFRKTEKKNLVETIFESSFLLNKFYKYYSELESVAISKMIFSDIKNKVSRNDQKMYVFRIPTREQILKAGDYSRFSLEDFFNSKEINFYDISNDLNLLGNDEIERYYLDNDSHLSKDGTKFVAEYIYLILKSEDIL